MSGAYLLVGEGTLAEGVEEALRESGEVVRWLRRPVDRDLRRALEEPTQAAVVINRDDIAALRTALLVEYLRPEIRLVVTIFDRTVAEQLIRVIPNCNVVSMADASAGAIVGPCLDPRLVALHRGDGGELIAVRGGDDEQPQVAPYPYQPPSAARRAANRLRAQFRPPDRSSALLLWSLFGLLALVLLEAVLAIATHHEPAVTALYEATKAIAAVGPSAFFEHGSTWQQLYGIASMAIGVVLTAVFTAALVNRVLSRRLTGTFGSRTIPRAGHVVVVGLGQVGFRVCLELRALGIAVVAVEQDAHAPNVALARGLKVPVVIGRGGDRYVLERLSLGRAIALAAVTSDELANISISVSALAVEPGLRTVLRAGSNEVTRETAALFPIGVAQDLDRVAAAAVAATAIGHELAHAFVHRGETYIETTDGIERFPPAAA